MFANHIQTKIIELLSNALSVIPFLNDSHQIMLMEKCMHHKQNWNRLYFTDVCLLLRLIERIHVVHSIFYQNKKNSFFLLNLVAISVFLKIFKRKMYVRHKTDKMTNIANVSREKENYSDTLISFIRMKGNLIQLDVHFC